MGLPLRPSVLLLAAVLLGAVAAPRAHAQVTARTLEEGPGHRIVEVTAAWPTPLAAAVDSAAAVEATVGAGLAVTGGALTHSELIELPARARPRLTVLASAFDEVRLPAAASPGAQASVRAELARPAAEVVGVGLHRTRPAATLVARLATYDPAAETLRRYRRLVVRLDYAAPADARPRQRAVTNPHLQVARSVLADGTVFRLPVREEGIYRIERGTLSDLGLDPDAVDPNTVKVYGNGGAPVPALNGADRYADLVENAVLARGGGDGSFDDGDVVLFYAAAPQGWRYDAEAEGWTHYTHPFSNDNTYFLKVGGSDGQRLAAPAFPGWTDAAVLDRVEGRHVVEMDTTIWSADHGSGLTWVSRQIFSGDALPILQDEALPGLAAGEVTYEARFAIRSNPRASVAFESGGTRLAEALARRTVGTDATNPVAIPDVRTFTQTVGAGAALNLSMRLLPQVGEPQAALDWLRVVYPQALRAEGGWLRFATPAGQAGRLELVLRGFAQAPQVWDVTKPDGIRRLPVTAGSGGAFRVQLQVADGAAPREIVAFTEGVARPVEADRAERVAAQNLHGVSAYPELVIVAPAAFREAAEALAQYRRQQGMEVVVAGVQPIYNEFSGGVPDMRAVRDYFKFLYDRAPDDDRRLRYALLFGDGHFNFRGLGATKPVQSNWVLPYATDESFDPNASFTSDDYFGLLDDDEGVWPWRDIRAVSDERVDLGIGRFPVQTVAEAQMMVDKIKRYESPETYGAWRSVYTYVADDGPTGQSGTQNDLDLHVQNVDAVATLVDALAPQVDARKIYALSYPRVFLNGFRIPEAKQDILRTIESGTLVMNYSGHGGPDGLAQEEIFTSDDARALRNKDRLPVFITATCSFGWWDLDDQQSGAEVMLNNPEGGAIALMTTVRLVYTSGDTTALNVGLNRALNQALFGRDEDGGPVRLGDAMRIMKNTSVGLSGNSRKFNLLGDPSMRLGLPGRDAAVETVNGVDLQAQPAPLRALDRVTLRGTVRTPDGAVDAGFDGDVVVTVYDAERQVRLPYRSYMPTPYYTVQEDLIWRGTVRAAAGRYEATFVVPKDISYSNAAGRISVYAASGATHALGATDRVVVGGTADTVPDDGEGPAISLFLNDTTFVSGGLTTPQPELIVRLYDESGINTVGAGVGHEMLLVINGDEQGAIDLSDQFRSDPNSFQRGTVRLTLPDQEPGPNRLSVRAWDVLNNSGTAELDYVVTADAALMLRNVYNYPNPMSRETRFVFEHNQPSGTPARIQVRIYTLNGRPVRTIERDEALVGNLVQIPWDGYDEDFSRLATGVYLYKVRVEVDGPDGEREVAEQIEKLALIR